MMLTSFTAQKMKKSLMEIFIFCAMFLLRFVISSIRFMFNIRPDSRIMRDFFLREGLMKSEEIWELEKPIWTFMNVFRISHLGCD